MNWSGYSITLANKSVFPPHVSTNIYQHITNLSDDYDYEEVFMVTITTSMRVMEVRMSGFQKKILLTRKTKVSIPLINNNMIRNTISFLTF